MHNSEVQEISWTKKQALTNALGIIKQSLKSTRQF